MPLVVWYGLESSLVHLGDLGVKWHGGTTAGCPKNPRIWEIPLSRGQFRNWKPIFLSKKSMSKLSCCLRRAESHRVKSQAPASLRHVFFRFISLSGRGGSRGHTMWNSKIACQDI